MKDIGISVVITAYNRKEFLADAINSVIYQTTEGFSCEIIVVSNFTFDVSSLESNYEIRTVLMSGTIGEFLYVGLLTSKYEIVAFLDDDDTFEKGKLLRLAETFSANPELCYYHNDLKYVDAHMCSIDYVRLVEKKSNLLDWKNLLFDADSNLGAIKSALKSRGDFNLSSIAIRRNCYQKYVSLLKQIKSNQDGFFFWIGLISMGKLMIDNKRLTNYRIHEANVSGQVDFIAKNTEIQKQIYTYDLILNLLTDRSNNIEKTQCLKRWIVLCKYEYELMSALFAGSPKVTIMKLVKKLLSTGLEYSNALKYRLIFYAMIGIISINFAHKVYLKARLLSNLK